MEIEAKEARRAVIIQAMLDRHVNLNREKCVSYLPVASIKDLVPGGIKDYILMAQQNGNAYEIIKNAGCIQQDVIYVYSPEHLTDLLKENSQILFRLGWPTGVEEFILKLSAAWCDDCDPIMPIIMEAFGDILFSKA